MPINGGDGGGVGNMAVTASEGKGNESFSERPAHRVLGEDPNSP